MTQETTIAFGLRFEQAVEGHPSAPVTPHGRQKWMLDKLEQETGLKVSANTMSKWMHGQAMPRGDNVRKIAQVLNVDEVWLSLGRNPVLNAEQKDLNVGSARGAVLALAGLIEMQGGRVSFATDPETPVDLHVNMGATTFEAIVVSPQIAKGQWSFIVPEPIGDSRVLAVVTPQERGSIASACLSVIELTEVPRQSLGGYSIVVLEARKDCKFKAEGQRALLAPISSLEELAGG